MSDLPAAREPQATPDPTDIPDSPTTAGDMPVHRSRLSTALAIFLVVAIGGAGLFISGFALGRLAGATPGTSQDNQELFRPFWDAYNDITNSYVGKVDQHLLVEGAIGGLFGALNDPFSQYLTEEQYRSTLSGLSGEFSGVGVQVATLDGQGNACDTISDACHLSVIHVVRNSPAQKAGILDDDVIVAIDNSSTNGLSVDDAAGRLSGDKGTSVAITVDRSGATKDFSVVRDVIQREDVVSEVMSDGKVGYIKIAGFSSASSSDFHNLLNELVNTSKVQAIVLDLRDDPGGYVDAAQKIASEFVGDKPLYFEQSANSDPVPQQPIAGGVATNSSVPVVVLVNGGTASASEIVSAAIQGNGRGQLVGSKTYGKGTIQEFKELPGAGGYRLSVRKWLTPDLTWINGIGLLPNVEAQPPDNEPAGQDTVLEEGIQIALEELANPSATFPAPPTYPPVSPSPSASPSAVSDQSVLVLSLAALVIVG